MRMWPVFLRLEGLPVTVVGGGRVALDKARRLRASGAQVTVVAPEIVPELRALAPVWRARAFEARDLDGAWLAIAAAPSAVNAAVRAAADRRRVFCVAVDDPARASAFGAASLERGGVEIAVATGGEAPALAALLRELLAALVPPEVARWYELARQLRAEQRRTGVPFAERRHRLARALCELHGAPAPTAALPAAPSAPGSAATEQVRS
ncbi:MAG: hypothetical protein HY908_28385 [Myxococcales bacterium]|nr:hypothetical protein [Myxococcales bacterium]